MWRKKKEEGRAYGEGRRREGGKGIWRRRESEAMKRRKREGRKEQRA